MRKATRPLAASTSADPTKAAAKTADFRSQGRPEQVDVTDFAEPQQIDQEVAGETKQKEPRYEHDAREDDGSDEAPAHP